MAHYTIAAHSGIKDDTDIWYEDCTICKGHGTDNVVVDHNKGIEHHSCERCGAYGSFDIATYHSAMQPRNLSMP